jgi:hypothetical protein
MRKTYPQKNIIGGVKGSENIQPGSAELKKRGQNMTMCKFIVWCLSKRVSVSRDITHSTSTRMFSE